jgi:hypothetical protein
MEEHFKHMAVKNHPPVNLEQDSQRDEFGNSKEDLITCAIIESLDVGKFHNITSNNDLFDVQGRIDAFGVSPGVLYSCMKKHFAQLARAAQNPAEAGARAGSGSAKAPETLQQIQCHLEEIQAQQSKKVEHESKCRVTPHGAPRRVVPHRSHHLAKNKAGAETLELARRRVLAIEAKIKKPESEGLLVDSLSDMGGAHARPAKNKARDKITGGAKTKPRASLYLKDPVRMSTCKPSEALRSKLRTIIEELLKQDSDFSKRDLQNILDRDFDENDKTTAAMDYHEWNASEKHKEAIDAFLKELVESMNPTPRD